jgi:O-acetylserine/cysteine efflux transporter
MTGRDTAIAIWAVFLFSANLIVQKIAVGELSIFVLSFLRVVLVFPLLFMFPRPSKSIWKHFICGFFLLSLYLILFGFGLKTDIGAGISSFFLQMQVFFTILCCFLILGEKPTWVQVTGILISFIGVYLLKASSSPLEFPLFGIVLLIASCLSYGIGISLTKKYEIGGNMSDIIWFSISASVPLFLACLVFEGPNQTLEIIVDMSSIAIFCVLFAIFSSTLWGTYLWLSLLQRAPISSVAPFMLLLPIFSIIIANVTLGETLTTFQMLSGVVIIFGVMFSQGVHQRVPLLFYWVKNKVA